MTNEEINAYSIAALLLLLTLPYIILTILSLRYVLITEPRLFKQSFENFNALRVNPLSQKDYKRIYDYQKSFVMAYFTGGEFGNQRDGDELMTNADRSAQKRIIDHLNLNRSAFLMQSLGYDFKSKKNLEKFLLTLANEMPQECQRIFPINKEWVILNKTSNGKYGISFSKRMLLNLGE